MARDARAVVDRLERTAWCAVPRDLATTTSTLVASVHDLDPRRPPPHITSPSWSVDAEAAVLAFAEQFAVDVSTITEDARRAMLAALGDNAFTYVQALYVFDVMGRARALLDALGLTAAPDDAGDVESFPDLWTGIDTFLKVVPGLDALDPVTTELVRLRLACHHNCRLCKSLRSYSALAAGADTHSLGAIVIGTEHDLDAATIAALALVDAFAWTPGRVPAELCDALHQEFTNDQLVEMVLDTARNAANKIAVALAADDPHVADGCEVYDVAADGTVTYGLTWP